MTDELTTISINYCHRDGHFTSQMIAPGELAYIHMKNGSVEIAYQTDPWMGDGEKKPSLFIREMSDK